MSSNNSKKNDGMDKSVFWNRASKENRNIQTPQKGKSEIFKEVRGKKTNTNLKTGSYESKNIRSIYCRKGIKANR